jgi:hypothetical protein
MSDTRYPLPSGVRTNAAIVATGTTYAPPLTALYVKQQSTLVVTLYGNGATVDLGTVAAGTMFSDFAIKNVQSVVASAVVGFW